MANVHAPVTAFTGGQVGQLLQARVDIPTYPAASELMENVWPLAQGPMTRRPPLEYIDTFADSSATGVQVPFVFSAEQSYNILLTPGVMRFYIQDGRVDIPSVTASITNGTFATAGSWFDQSTMPSVMTLTDGKMFLDSAGGDSAAGEQAITIVEVGTLHVLVFSVVNGPVNLSIGSTSGATDYVGWTDLGTGLHYIEFTPTAAVAYIRFWHQANAGRIIDDVSILRATTSFTVAHPYLAADLAKLQWRLIGDNLYLTCAGYHPRRLRRRGHRSWSLELLLSNSGPFGSPNTTPTTLTPSDTDGEITLTASAEAFDSRDQYALYQLTHSGQDTLKVGTAAGDHTNGVKIVGIGSGARSFAYYISGTWVGSVVLQRSSGNENSYTDYQTFTANASNSLNDGLDNQTWFYRLFFKTRTSGSATMEIIAQGGSQTGICRIVEVISTTSVKAEVLSNFGQAAATNVWRRGSWTAKDGYPVAVTHGYGRLWLGRGINVWGSESDNFTGFDASNTDADKSIAATMATSQDGIRWLAFGAHLLIGTQTGEAVGFPNTSSQPVGPTNFQIKPMGQDGSAQLHPVIVQGTALYLHRSRRRLMQLTQDPKALSETSYTTIDLNRLSPDLLWDSVVSIAVQDEPERRIYVVLASGVMRVLLFRRDENVIAWSTVMTQGVIENVNVIAQDDQDAVYMVVRRKINGTWGRFVERLGSEITLNDEAYYHLDSAMGYTLVRPQTAITPSALSGSITIEADDPVWLITDVGWVVWVNGGQATITGYVSSTVVNATVSYALTSTELAPASRWGMNQPALTLSGLDHLDGASVRVVADGADFGHMTVTGGAVTLPRPVTIAYVGLDFDRTGRDGRWKSQRLSYGAQRGTALTMTKAVKGVGLILHRSGPGISFGPSFEATRPVQTRVAGGQIDAPIKLFTGEKVEAFDARYDTDPRFHVVVSGPHPATLLGYVPNVETHDR